MEYQDRVKLGHIEDAEDRCHGAFDYLIGKVEEALLAFDFKAANEVTGYDFIEWFIKVALESDADYTSEHEAIISRDETWRNHVLGLATDFIGWTINDRDMDFVKVAEKLAAEAA